MNHNRGDVYLVLYPFDDGHVEKLRPAIIFDTQDGRSIVIKVTTHKERTNDPYDIAIVQWRQAGLDEPSVVRCAHFVPLRHDKIVKFLGVLDKEDLICVLERFYDQFV